MNKQQLFENIQKKQSFLCVGLDTDIKKIPQHLLSEEDPLFAFNRAIIDATAPYCVAYKPNMAFYESMGVKGIEAFEKTVAYLRENYPDQFIIADAKRGDIGNTSEMYARSFFDHIKVDAVTVAPYMGEDSVKPFLIYPEAWVILLALTSNKGSHDFQLTEDANGERLFEKVLKKITGMGDRRADDVRRRRDTGENVLGHPQICASSFPVGSGRRCTGRQPGRGGSLWDERAMRPVGQFVTCHHLRGQNRAFCRSSRRGSSSRTTRNGRLFVRKRNYSSQSIGNPNYFYHFCSRSCNTR